MRSDTAWVTDIRDTRHIGDFSHWSDQNLYQRGLEHLLRDLQTGAETPPTLPTRFATVDNTIDSLRRQLARHHANLNKLREDAAIYGAGDVPLRLQNQIEVEQHRIAEIEAELRSTKMEKNQ